MTDPSLPSEPSEPPADAITSMPVDAPPPVGWSASLPTPAVPLSVRPLPGSILATGVLLLVGAVLAGLLTLFIAFAVFAVSSMPVDLAFDGSGLSPDEIEASMAVAGVVVVIFGAVGALAAISHLVAGIGVLRRRGWARILGLVLAVLGLLAFLVLLVASVVSPDVIAPESGLTEEEYRQFALVGRIIGLGIVGIGLAVYTFVLVVLARRGSEFT